MGSCRRELPLRTSALLERGRARKEKERKAEEKSIVRVPVNFCSRRMPGLGREALGEDRSPSRFASLPAGLRGKRPMRRSGKKLPTFCVFCKNNNESEAVYTSHVLKDQEGRVVCPALYIYKCPICQNTGHEAHTVKHCPYNPDLLRKQTQLAEIWRSYRESNPLESSSQPNIRQGMETQASLGLKSSTSMSVNMMGAGNTCARDTFSALSGRAEMSQTFPGPPSPPMSEPQSWSPWTLGSQSSLGSLGSSSWSSPSPSGCWTPPSSPPMPSLMSPSSPPSSPATQGENHLMENLIKLL